MREMRVVADCDLHSARDQARIERNDVLGDRRRERRLGAPKHVA
jgi:hypothetical protein